MVEGDGRKQAEERAGDDVGRVQRAAHADLQKDRITALLYKPGKRHGGLHLEDRRQRLAPRLHAGTGIGHLLCQCGKLVPGNGRAAAQKPLFIGKKSGRDIAAGPAPRLLQNRIEEGEHGAFAVRAGDMDKTKLFLRVAKLPQKRADPLETGTVSGPADPIKPG